MVGQSGQTKAIKEYLESGKSITSIEAFEKFGCTRLSAKIFDLKKSGMPIYSEKAYGLTRYGTTCIYSVYKLLK